MAMYDSVEYEDMVDMQVVLDDELQWTFAPRRTDAGRARAAAIQRQMQFRRRWEEKAEAEGSRDRDIDRLLDVDKRSSNSSSSNADRLSAQAAIRLDRARRIAFGYAKPPPMSVAHGRDGGIDTALFCRRRPRPDDDSLSLDRTSARPLTRADTATPCRPPAENQFDVFVTHRALHRKNKGKGKAVVTRAHPDTRAGRRQHQPLSPTTARRQRAAAQWMLRQPARTVLEAALRRLD